MKKLLTMLLAFALVLALGAVAFAASSNANANSSTNNGNGNGNGNASANGNGGNSGNNNGNNAKSANDPAPVAAPTQTIYLKGSGSGFDASGWNNVFFADSPTIYATAKNQCWHLVYSGKNINMVTSMQISFVDKNGGPGYIFNWTPAMGFSSNGGGNNLGWVIYAPDNFTISYVDKGNNNNSDSFVVTAETGNAQFNISGYKAGDGSVKYKCGSMSVTADTPIVITKYKKIYKTVTLQQVAIENDDSQGDEDGEAYGYDFVGLTIDKVVHRQHIADFAGVLTMEVLKDGNVIYPSGALGDLNCLEPGDYTVNLLADGHVVATQVVTVVAGQTTLVHFDKAVIVKHGKDEVIVHRVILPIKDNEDGDDQGGTPSEGEQGGKPSEGDQDGKPKPGDQDGKPGEDDQGGNGGGNQQ